MKNIDREQLKNKIKEIPGAIAVLAKRANCSKSFVSQVLSGKKNSNKIIDLAIELVEEYKVESKRRNNKIENL